MSKKGVQLLHDHVRAAALIDQAIRAVIEGGVAIAVVGPAVEGLIPADAWIILAMTGWLDGGVETIDVAKGTAELASQIGFARERTVSRVGVLLSGDLVVAHPAEVGGDKRRRSYLLSQRGRALATWLYSEISQLDARVRRAGGIAANARALDVQKVTLGLCDGDRESATATWLDRQRLDRSPFRKGPKCLTCPVSSVH